MSQNNDDRATVTQVTAGAVRAELARLQLSGRDLARGCGWSTATTGRRLNGQTPFTVDEIVAVARYLDVPVGDLISARKPEAGRPAVAAT